MLLIAVFKLHKQLDKHASTIIPRIKKYQDGTMQNDHAGWVSGQSILLPVQSDQEQEQ
jgi:hypothetical protein